MALFHENIKQLLAEVEKFLTESLRKEKLGKKASEHRALILDKLTCFLEENPSMRLVLSQDTISVSDDSTMTGGSSKSDESEDNYIDSGLSMVGVADLADPVYAAYMEKKQKKGSGLFGGSKFQSRWCVIHGGCFYYFAKPDDKKQHGSFRMDGYRFRVAPDMSSKKKEKELCFEMYHPDDKKRVYQFMARSKEELVQWQTFIESGGHMLIEEDLYEELENTAPSVAPPAPAPAPALPPPPPPATITVEEPSPDDGELYEDPDGPPPLPPPTTTPHLPPPPIPSLPPTSKNLPPPPPPPASRSPVTPPKSPRIPEPPQSPDAGEELYNDAISPLQEAASTPPVPGRHLPPPPDVPPTPPPTIPSRPKRDLPELPPTPTPKKRVKVNITCKPEEDFENKFYGKWDCTGDNVSELSFKRGDVIHVLNREFDEKAWWIGELNGKFGLVPKTFLVPAYTLVTQ